MRIILIDDDDIFNMLHEAIIQRVMPDAEVLVFKSGEEFFERLQQKNSLPLSADLMLLDIRMPGLSGFDILDQLKESETTELQKTNIYLLSSTLDERDLNRAKVYDNICEFINKPLTIETFTRISSRKV